MKGKGIRRAVVLAGGGARGAYEAGVLRFIQEHISTPDTPDFDIVTGSSIGAINGCFIASMGIDGASRLSGFWRQLRPEHVYDFGRRDLITTPARFLQRRPGTGEGAALWNSRPLRRLLRRTIPWPALYERLDSGELAALVVAATDVGTGATVLFADGSIGPRPRSHSRVIPTRIGPAHALASSAIPLIFPAVDVDGRTYVDGSLRQNTPLAPAIDVGADRVLVIGVSRPRTPHRDDIEMAPTPLFLAGKAFNALLLDPIDDDLRQLRGINELLQIGEDVHPGFLEHVAGRSHQYRIVEPTMIRPSFDIGTLAAEAFSAHKGELPWASRMLLGVIGGSEPEDEADLVSYLYMHAPFTRALEQAGFDDAEKRADVLAAFFED
ncbi:MAG: patatin-like phospholipase family protein [Proteobacteria bacterium]|nr:patatin-like phospholipase family protein [Pseudomonadota bacterium]